MFKNRIGKRADAKQDSIQFNPFEFRKRAFFLPLGRKHQRKARSRNLFIIIVIASRGKVKYQIRLERHELFQGTRIVTDTFDKFRSLAGIPSRPVVKDAIDNVLPIRDADNLVSKSKPEHETDLRSRKRGHPFERYTQHGRRQPLLREPPTA